MKAVTAHQAGRLDEAIAGYRMALLSDPDSAEVYNNLGLALQAQGKLDDAIASYRKALAHKPNFAEVYGNLGNALHAQGDLAEAVNCFRKAISLKPDFADLHYNLGLACKDLGKLDEAVESYRQALLLRPDNFAIHTNLGNALQEQGKLDDAVASYRQALLLKPDLYEAHFNLGNIFRQLGQLDQAIESYQLGILFKPNLAWVHDSLGSALRDQGKQAEAMTSYRQAIALKPDFAEAHYNLGVVLRDQGRLNEAMTSFRQTIALKPDSAEAHFNLGNVLRDQRRLKEAMSSFLQAIALKPDFAEAHGNLGNVFFAQGKLQEATASFRQAIALKPDFAEAHCNLATTYIDLGQFEDARAALNRALEIDPEYPLALAKLSLLRKMTPEDEDWLNTVLKLLSSAELQDKKKPPLLFALGKYYDDIKQYDLAFPAYQQANTLQRQIDGGFDRAAHTRLIDAIIAAWPVDFVSRVREAASPSRLPVLVVGMMRSGTSLTEQIIASHPEAFGAGELGFWTDLFADNQAELLSGNYGAPLASRFAAEYQQTLQRHSADALRIVDKMPHNFVWLGLIHEVFPQAKIVHVRRNPVDTCLSIYFQYLTAINAFATDLDDIAFFYREYVRLIAHWRKALPADCFMEISYEDLIDDPPAWSRRIIEFIGLDWDERCLDFHQTERRVGTASNWQVRQPIYQTSRARWRHYEKHLGTLLELLDLK